MILPVLGNLASNSDVLIGIVQVRTRNRVCVDSTIIIIKSRSVISVEQRMITRILMNLSRYEVNVFLIFEITIWKIEPVIGYLNRVKNIICEYFICVVF